MATPTFVGDGNDDGEVLGRSGGKAGFYGLATPVVQPSVTHIGTTTISQVATSGKWAFASSTAALAFISLTKSLQNALDTLNLVDKT
jgi:hypothetical protein